MDRAGERPPLPVERSSFVGRRRELDDVRQLLGRSRLVTISGAGGVGKTRLALRVAHDVRRAFPDGTAFADLVAIQEPALLAGQVASALDVRDVSGRWLTGGLAEVVGGRSLLLVLDNCEHLRDACAVLADTLLTSCPRLRVLATSRRPLDVDGESVYPLAPLPVPAATDVDAAGFEAVQLLVDRARAVDPTLPLSPQDLMVLGELCRGLDGVPLAIELAAVRLRTLAPSELLERLEDRFAVLRRSGPAVPERHRTLRATLDWSHGLLDEPERLLWRRASVFAGAFDLGAAEAVCADAALPAEAVLDSIDRLVGDSVLEVIHGARGPRFRMLETVRAFGRDLLTGSAEQPAVRARHRAWCAAVAAQASEEFLGPGQVEAFDALASWHVELGAALDFCLTTPGEQRAGLRIATDLWLYWQARGHLGEGRRWLDLLLDAVPDGSPELPRGLVAAGYLALAAADPASGVPLLHRAMRAATATGQGVVQALATEYLGQAALFDGDLRRADAMLRNAVDQHLANDPRYAAFCLADVGITAWLAGAYPAAAEAFEESLLRNQGGDPWTRSHALWGLGLTRLCTGQAEQAAALFGDALALMARVDDRSALARCVEALGWAEAAQEHGQRAAVLMGAANAVRRSVPAELPPSLVPFRDGFVERVRRSVGEERWTALFAEGNALDRAAALALAAGEDPAGPAAGSAPAPPGSASPLTARQREVAALVAEGLTDREIAARLVISPRTAEYHVEQILTRLGFRSRTEIAAWAAAGASG